MVRAVLPLLFALTACADSAVRLVTPPAHVEVGGRYEAVVAGSVHERRLDGIFTVTVTQEGDSLSGEYTLQVTLSSQQGSAAIVHTGRLAGEITSHDTGAMRFRIDNAECPRYFMDFTGSYDEETSSLLLSGAVDVINTIGGLCHLAERFPSTLRFMPRP